LELLQEHQQYLAQNFEDPGTEDVIQGLMIVDADSFVDKHLRSQEIEIFPS
jgi:hypothetical protein